MSMFIHHELFLVIQALGTGAVLLLCYDLLKVFRKYAVRSRKISNAQDILYWIGSALYIFARTCRNNDGNLRFYMILSLAAGAGLCHLTVSPFFVKFCGILFDICIIIGKKIIKWLLFPVKRCKLLWYKAYKCAKKGRLANWVILRIGRKKRK